MGYSTRNNGQIKDFWPDDDESTMYFSNDETLEDIFDKACEKWPGILMEELKISSEYIHTSCLTYDRYDPSDWTNFLRISRI